MKKLGFAILGCICLLVGMILVYFILDAIALGVIETKSNGHFVTSDAEPIDYWFHVLALSLIALMMLFLAFIFIVDIYFRK